jgi:signal transduction histidine kinase
MSTNDAHGAGPPTAPLRVVVVDDTPDLRDLMRMALERSGDFVVVGEADNGRAGVEATAEHQPDVVFLDIAMPVMDGLEALPLARAACPGATIVMLSGFGASEMTGRAMEGGADGYIQKGQPLGALLTQVRALVDRAEARRSGGSESAADPVPDERVPVLDPLELAPFGVLQVRSGRIVHANREAGRLVGDLATADRELARVAPALAAHLAEGHRLDTTVVLELGDPARQVVTSVRRSGEDDLVYLQAQTGDEADLLRRAIATAAHEIRGPVGVLMGVAETLTLHGDDLSEHQRDRMLAVIGRQTRLLDNITADLLAAGLAQHGTLAIQLERVDVAELVRSVVDDGFALTLVEHSPTHVLTDPLRFQQMLSNLLSNARKYGEPPFHVRITSEGSAVTIDVADNGPGIPEDFRPLLFQEYSRAPGTSARGTGLGLFVVRALAEAQGGTVTYTPGQPRGAVFTLRLPGVPA